MTDSATRPDGGAISRLEAARPSLSASERRTVEVILANPGAVLQMSMAEVADSAGVSDTTVLRACRTAGFAGFTELKLRLAQDLARPESLIHDDVDADDDDDLVARLRLQNRQRV